MNRPLLLAGAALACGAPALAAQGGAMQWVPSTMQGMLANAPAGLLVRGAPGGTSALVMRGAGPATGEPIEWSEDIFGAPGAGHPDYSTAALLAGINRLPHSVPATELELGGFSTGGDVCPPIDLTGRLLLGNSWYFLSITVGDMPAGAPSVYGVPGSTLRSLASPERAILSYYLEGSVGIDTMLVNSTAAEQTSAQLGFPASSPADVAGVDWAMGAISVDPFGVRSMQFAPVRDRFYFTVTSEWLAANPTHFVFVSQSSAVLLDAATVYVMEWKLVGESYGWAAPEIAFSGGELFGAAAGTKEIDAISVFAPGGNSPIARIVLSTTLESLSEDELLAFDRETMGAAALPATPLRTATGTRLSDKLGLRRGPGEHEIDNVNGTCGGDPERGVINGTLGFPITRFDTLRRDPLGLAMVRSISSPAAGLEAVDRVDLRVTGIDLAPSTSGFVVFQFGLLTAQQVQALDIDPAVWIPLAAVPVAPGSSIADYACPGDLGELGPLCVTAALYASGTSTPLRTSWITVLDY